MRKWFEVLVRAIFLRFGLSIERRASTTSISKALNLLKPRGLTEPLVRLGGETDGGYLLPNPFSWVDGIISPGVGPVAKFEMEFARREVPCTLIDGSVKGPPQEHRLFRFLEKYLVAHPRNSNEVSLEETLQDFGSSRNLILQMDIEGQEYEVLLEARQETLQQFRVIVIEFHGLYSLATQSFQETFVLTLTRLLKSHFIVHTHPNNCCPPIRLGKLVLPDVVEVTLVRRDSYEEAPVSPSLPHPLDRPNTNRKDWSIVWTE